MLFFSYESAFFSQWNLYIIFHYINETSIIVKILAFEIWLHGFGIQNLSTSVSYLMCSNFRYFTTFNGLSICLSPTFLFISTYLSIHIYLSISLLFTSLLSVFITYLSIYLFTYLSTYLSSSSLSCISSSVVSWFISYLHCSRRWGWKSPI